MVFLFGFFDGGYLQAELRMTSGAELSLLSDSQLLQLYVEARSQDAFEQLVQRHLPMVYRSALRQLHSDAHRARDAAQLVFVELARRAGRLRTHTNLAAWLYTATHGVSCQLIRTEMRRRKRETEWAAVTAAHTSSESPTWTTIEPLLDKSLRTLPEKDREAVLLRYFENNSYAEIAGVQRTREDAARMRVNRALEKLRDAFAAEGANVTPAVLGGLLASDAALGAPTGLAATIASVATQAAAPAASVSAAIVSFMAGSKLITGTIAVATALTLGWTVQQWGAKQVAESDLQFAAERLGALQRRLTEQETTRRAPSSPASSAGPARTSAVSSQANDPLAAERAKSEAFLTAHPELREPLLKAQRARIRGKYLPLYRELNLSAAQIDAFEALAVRMTGRVVPDVGSLWIGEYLSPGDFEQRVRALLGDAGYARYSAARVSRSGYAVAEQLAARLAETDTPLTPETSALVRDVVESERSRVGENGEAWPAILTRLGEDLTPTQVQEAKAIAALDRYQRAQAARESRPNSSTP